MELQPQREMAPHAQEVAENEKLGKIFIGRFGYRGAKKILPEEEMVVVDCRKVGDDKRVKDRAKQPLEDTMGELIALYPLKFILIVNSVIKEVVAGNDVCCACMLGRYRSQAVALGVKSYLASQGKVVEVEYLSGIKKTE